MRNFSRNKVISILRPFLAVSFGLFLGLMITLFAGESPLFVLKVLFNSAFGSWYDFGLTLFYTLPLILTGLAVAIGLEAGLFNIGAEGQLTMGALSCALVGILLPEMSPFLAIPLGIIFSFLGGALWGGVAGLIKAKRGGHEVITTIMMNFIAAGISSFVTLYLVRNKASQNPETMEIGASYQWGHFPLFEGAPVGAAIIPVLITVFLIWFLFAKTELGFRLRSTGQNDKAAAMSGINISSMTIIAMVLSGGVAGLVGVVEVMGNAYKFKMGFSPGFGFIGIAVALLARGNPWSIIFSGLLFGALHKGTGDLDFETENITRELSLILQALIILSASADGLWDKVEGLLQTKKRKV